MAKNIIMENTKENLRTAPISAALLGANTIIAAPTIPGNYLAIDFISFMLSGDNTVTFKSGTNVLSGPIPFVDGQGVAFENAIKHVAGVITCLPNEALIINLSAATPINGWVRYREVGN